MTESSFAGHRARPWPNWLLGTILASALSHPRAALAAPPTTSERNLAEQLFLDGKSLMAAGKYDEACPKLAESQRLDPGGGTILNLAVCHEAQGRYASAWSELREALALARTDGRRDREQFAVDNLLKVEPKISRLTLAVDKAADVQGLSLELDGEVISRVAWDTALPIDPGVHQIKASAPGKKARDMRVVMAAVADHKIVSIAPLESAIDSTPVALAPVPWPESPESRPTPAGRTIGWVVGGFGVVALGAGAVLGLEALSKRKESDQFCRGSTCSQQRGIDLNDQAKRFARYADVGIGVGVVALFVGAYLTLASDSSEPAQSPVVEPGSAGSGLSMFVSADRGSSGVGLSGAW